MDPSTPHLSEAEKEKTHCLSCDGPWTHGREIISCDRCGRWAHFNAGYPVENNIDGCCAAHPTPDDLYERFLDDELNVAWLATCVVCRAQRLSCCLERCNCEESQYYELPEERYHICTGCASDRICIVCEEEGNDYSGPSCESMDTCACGTAVCWRHDGVCRACEEV